jgi:hypothetical protein
MFPHRGVLTHRIPAQELGGLIFAAGTAVILLLGVPALRPIVALAVVGGVVLAPILHRLGR